MRSHDNHWFEREMLQNHAYSRTLSGSAGTLEKIFGNLSKEWLPVNREVINVVIARFEEGDYEKHRAALIEDLKKDLGLYTLCLREIASCDSAIHTTNGGMPAHEILTEIDIEVIKDIVTAAAENYSAHSIDDTREWHAKRIQQAFVSASTVEMLAEAANIDPDLGYTCGFLRHLSKALISWNYPRFYVRAFEHLTGTESLESALQMTLGVSPIQLDGLFARRWGLSEEIRIALGETANGSPRTVATAGKPSSRDVGFKLRKMCEIGDALARATDPRRFITASADWEFAANAIRRSLGEDGVDRVIKRANVHAVHFKATEMPKSESDVYQLIVLTNYRRDLLRRNSYLNRCSGEIRQDAVTFYNGLKPGEVSQGSLRTLLYDIFPKAGFENGCIFVHDQESGMLQPLTTFGSVSSERIRPVKLGSSFNNFDLIASAYACKSPLREEHFHPDGRRVTVIAGALGSTKATGVLFVETDTDFDSENSPDPVVVFRALRQCLSDCLNLE